jgi:phage-related protein
VNEELKIIITAVTDTAKKNIQGVKKELGNMGKEGGKSAGGLGKAFKGVGIAAGVAVAAITAVTTALVALGNNTKQYREEQARLNAAFLAAGSSSEQAAQSYGDLYRFLGDSGKASEAAAHLAKLTTNEQHLSEWTTALQGVYATFGDSLPIEGLTEAANETARVGQVTGTLADALNWAGVNEDAFNAQLAQCATLSEREALIRGTLNGLYSDAALIYEKNNADIIAQNEAQARLDATTAQLGKTVTPLITALLNLSNVLLTALGPAITWISNVLTALINIISKAVSWVMSFIGALGGSSKAATGVQGIANATAGIGSGMSSAAGGAGALTGNLDSATKAAEKLKRTTAGFDEMNIMSSQSSSAGAGAGGAGGGGIGGGGANLGGVTLDTGGLTGALDGASDKVSGFVQKMKDAIAKLKDVFAPTIDAWSGAFDKLVESWNNALPNFTIGFEGIKNGFMTVGTYILEEFVPNVVNSFSENLAPIYGDVWGFYLEEAGKNFALFGTLIDDISTNIINPALESIEMVVTDVFDAIGDAWDKHGAGFMEKITKFFDGIREDINEFYEAVILPIWTKIKAVFDKVWKEGLEPLVRNVADAAMEIGSCLLDLYNEFIKPIVDWIQAKIYPIIVKVVNAIIERAGDVLTKISLAVSGLVTTIKGIVQFITGVFTGNWKKAWEGVKNIFKGIWDALVNIVKIPINTIIGGINGLLKGLATAVNTVINAINKLSFTVPDWVPGIGGKKFGFNLSTVSAPQIPKLAKGGIVTAATQLIAGERGREAILPLENNTEWMEKLADRIAARQAMPSKIVLQIGEKELGWAAINSINDITKQTGGLQLHIV